MFPSKSPASLLLLMLLAGSAVHASAPRWEPQIAVLCEAGQTYHPQHLSEEGRWTTDLNLKASGNTCMRDKIDLLDHCKRVYPGRDITNIVESSHYQKIGGWCRQGASNGAKCKGAQRWIKPFRCLEGPFQSDALLVPEGCLFDHIHNASRCWPFGRWNQTGAAACQDREMQMRSFAMLLPCGISLFSGVEFVCCPKHFKGSDSIKLSKKTDLPVLPPAPMMLADQPQALPQQQSSIDLPSSVLDDSSDSDAATDEADDEDDLDEDDTESDEDMMADDAGASLSAGGGTAAELTDDDYDSDEDIDDAAAAALTASKSSALGRIDRDELPTGDALADDEEDDEDDEDSAAAAASAASDDDDPIRWSDAQKPNGAAQMATIKEITTAATTTSTAGGNGASTTDKADEAAQAAIDPYFTHFDPRAEHQSYKDAQQRLEETHREKVTRVMKDWSDLEEKYQDMRLADPKAAQTFKQRMTARFQTSVQALEEEGNAEKHQMAAMHQQRVLAHINQRKREAMNCYTQALIEQPPSAHRVEKCLQKLLRALHKDRAHALAHYRHLLSSGGAGGLEAAASERPRTLERLVDIDRAVNQSMTMLKRYPELSAKLSQLMDDYIQALRSKDDTPGAMLGMTEQAEAAILDKYRDEIERRVAEKERQRIAEKQRKEARSQEREKLRDDKMRAEAKKLELLVKQQQDEQQQQQKDQDRVPTEQSEQPQATADEQQQTSVTAAEPFADGAPATDYEPASSAVVIVSETTQEPGRLYADESAVIVLNNNPSERAFGESPAMGSVPTSLPTVDNAAVQRAVEEVAAAVAHQEIEPRAQHVMGHDLGHGEAAYAIRHEAYRSGHKHDGRNVHYTMIFVGAAVLAACMVGVVVTRRCSSRHPHSQGFIPVDQTAGIPAPVTPEEKHVVNMQINGYENPTYKYFEVKE